VSYRRDKGQFGRSSRKTEALDKLQADLRRPNVRPGDRWIVKSEDDTRFVVLAMAAGLPEAQPSFDISAGNAKIQKIVRVAAGFSTPRRLKSLGGYVCKFISGTRTPSQHCKFSDPSGCNAWDLAVRRLGLFSTAGTWKLVNYLVANADEIELGVIIFQDRIWTKSQGWHAYSGVYHSTHTHMEPDPERPFSKLACSPS
jgi:hypothetical protein